MSGPSSSDLINRKKFLITERNEPVPCCSPPSSYDFEYTDASGSIPEDEYDTAAVTATLTVVAINPIVVTAIANVSGTPTQAVTMGVFYYIGPPGPPETQIIPDTSATIPNTPTNTTLFATTTFTPTEIGTYTFFLRLKSTGTGDNWNNAALYVQGT